MDLNSYLLITVLLVLLAILSFLIVNFFKINNLKKDDESKVTLESLNQSLEMIHTNSSRVISFNKFNKTQNIFTDAFDRYTFNR